MVSGLTGKAEASAANASISFAALAGVTGASQANH
jgi:hypothetical protein